MEKYLKLGADSLNLAKIQIPKQSSCIVLTAFPGRNSDNSFSQDNMITTFNYLENEDCLHFLSLVEDHEFSEYCQQDVLATEANKRSINWHHLPIVDMKIPEKNVLNKIISLRSDFTKAITSGYSIGIHCKGGLGRSGTIAAVILVDLGFSSKTAIETVRKFRPGAIETKEQEAFVSSIKPFGAG